VKRSAPLVLLASNTAWSVANFRGGLMRGLQRAGYRLAVAAPADRYAGELPCDFVAIRVARGGLNPFEDLRLLRELRAVYRRLAPRAVLHFTAKLNIYGTLACHSLGIASVASVTGLGSGFIAGGPVAGIMRGLYRFALRRAGAIFFQNPDDRQYFIERKLVPESLAKLVPGSGVDLQRYAPREAKSSGSFVFLFIGRLLADKGLREYVAAARLIRQSSREVVFRVVGDADDSNPSGIRVAELRKWEKEGAIEYLGQLADVRPAIAAADCVVLPSYREGTPRTLLEAAAMARPLIASDVPGCRQVIDDGRTGFLCQDRNSADLAAKMRRMMDLSEQVRKHLGQAGRAKMEREFDESIVVRAYLRALENLGIGKGGNGA
jgi:glycosyltransferase involved in cell wall biosynthesis